MKSNYLVYLVAAAFAVACAGSHAQQTDPKASAKDPQDTSKGQDLVGKPKPPPADPLKTPPTTGQDKSAGNNLVSGDNSGQMRKETIDFATLDAKKQGYLVPADVKTHTWITANFAHCDTDKDGRVTRKEYDACTSTK